MTMIPKKDRQPTSLMLIARHDFLADSYSSPFRLQRDLGSDQCWVDVRWRKSWRRSNTRAWILATKRCFW